MTKPRKSTRSRAKPMPRATAPKATGRPPVEVNEGHLEGLAQLGCTVAEMAAFLKVSEDTLSRRFAERIKEWRDAGRCSLRRWQWKKAKEGNVTMMIWLGKNELGQSDKQELTGKDGTPLAPAAITVRLVRPD